MKKICKLFFLFIVTTTSAQSFLSRTGNKLYDACGNHVRLTGVNWFGFETSNKVSHGLWVRDYQSMLQQIKALGFNCIRLPWSNEILKSNAMPSSILYSGTDSYNGTNPINGDLNGLTSMEVMDKIVSYCKTIGLKIILDCHSRKPDGYVSEEIWYLSDFTEQQWIDDWVSMVTRYKNNDAVIAADIDNEPHGQATWGDSNAATDWNKAAERCGNAILVAHPDILVMIEGVGNYNGSDYWWGGNLKGVASLPIVLSEPEKLVYSAHEYGPEVFQQPWFNDASFPANMKNIWDDFFGYIPANQNGNVFIGEFGIKDSTAYGGKALKWFDEFLKYMGANYSWTFWCFNPNSGDTDGILTNDWVSVNTWKVNRLKPYMAPLINSCSSNTNDVREVQRKITIYPNPVDDVLNIDLSLFENSANAELTVTDIQGKIILQKEIKGNTSLKIKTAELLNKGMYFITVKENHVQLTQKLIVP